MEFTIEMAHTKYYKKEEYLTNFEINEKIFSPCLI